MMRVPNTILVGVRQCVCECVGRHHCWAAGPLGLGFHVSLYIVVHLYAIQQFTILHGIRGGRRLGQGPAARGALLQRLGGGRPPPGGMSLPGGGGWSRAGWRLCVGGEPTDEPPLPRPPKPPPPDPRAPVSASPDSRACRRARRRSLPSVHHLDQQHQVAPPFELLPLPVLPTPLARSDAGPCSAGPAPSPSPFIAAIVGSVAAAAFPAGSTLLRPSRLDPPSLWPDRRLHGWIRRCRGLPGRIHQYPFYSAAGADTLTGAVACAAVGLPGGAP
jgi:hypothetical protein